MLLMAVDLSSSSGACDTCYVLPVLWMRSCMHTVAGIGAVKMAYTQRHSLGGSTGPGEGGV